MIDTLIIGDSTHELAEYASSIAADAQLLTNDNFDILDSKVCYTSIADLKIDLLEIAISKTNRIIYHPPKNWSSLSIESETILALTTCGKMVENLSIDPDPYSLLRLIDSRASENPQIWVTGCSIADGFGIPKDSRYGKIVADRLDMPVTFLTTVGTSIPWAADQLLRSELKEGDIIIWGLTSINRFSSYKNKIETHVLSGIFSDIGVQTRRKRSETETRNSVLSIQQDFERNLALLTKVDLEDLQKQLLDEDRLLQAIKSIYQVLNVCQLLKLKLVIFAHQISTDEFYNILLRYISTHNGYIHIANDIDLADDQMHPGIETNKLWATQILNKLSEMK